jgi:hypothetical protein
MILWKFCSSSGNDTHYEPTPDLPTTREIQRVIEDKIWAIVFTNRVKDRMSVIWDTETSCEVYLDDGRLWVALWYES